MSRLDQRITRLEGLTLTRECMCAPDEPLAEICRAQCPAHGEFSDYDQMLLTFLGVSHL